MSEFISADVVKLAAKWNNDRIKNGLKPFQ